MFENEIRDYGKRGQVGRGVKCNALDWYLRIRHGCGFESQMYPGFQALAIVRGITICRLGISCFTFPQA